MRKLYRRRLPESGPRRFSTTTLDNGIEIDVSIHYQARGRKHQAAVAVRALLPGDPVAKLKEVIRAFVERWMQDTYGLGRPVADTGQTRGRLVDGNGAKALAHLDLVHKH